MPSSIQKLAGARVLTARLKKRAKSVEDRFHGLRGPQYVVDWPKDTESLAIEQIVRELAQEILGTDDIPPALWSAGRPFALEIQKPYIAARKSAPFTNNADDQAAYERTEAEFFRGVQLWCDHTDDFLDYLSGYQACEAPAHSAAPNVVAQPPESLIYDVAISFAGEDRETARKIAEALRENGRRVFYDEYEKASLWGRDLYSHLSNVYKNKARFCLILISKHYKAKLWTKHELRSAQSRAFAESEDYILPLRMDDTEIDGILPTTGYLHIKDNSVEEIALTIQHKLDAKPA